jgi:flagellar FliL protein
MFTQFRYLLLLTLSLSALPTWAADEETPPSAVYYAIPEPFTINFLTQSKQKARYLQIKVSLMSHDQEVINQAELNLPMLQDELRTLFSEQSYDDVNSVEGRKALQASALEAVNSILKEETGKDDLEGVYFTSFIIQ